MTRKRTRVGLVVGDREQVCRGMQNERQHMLETGNMDRLPRGFLNKLTISSRGRASPTGPHSIHFLQPFGMSRLNRDMSSTQCSSCKYLFSLVSRHVANHAMDPVGPRSSTCSFGVLGPSVN